jgi:hypothetical protein
MNLSQLEDDLPYEDVIARLQSPTSSDIAQPDHPQLDPRAPVAEFLRGLRRRHMYIAAQFVRSPLVAPPETSVRDPSATSEFVARQPRRASRLVIADTIRTAKVSGVTNVAPSNTTEPDHTLLEFLRWLLEMEGLPVRKRVPFPRFAEISAEDTERWMTIGGPILGSFMNAVADRRQPKRMKRRGDWVTILASSLGDGLRTELGEQWVTQFGKEGAARLMEFEGPEGRPREA